VEVVHRIAGNWSAEDLAHLASLGVPVTLASGNTGIPGNRIGFLEVSEGGEVWKRVEAWSAGRGFLHTVGTRFSDEEVKAADWLILTSSQHGYPSEQGFAAGTFELHCPRCGWRDEQTSPFRMRSEPKWGRRGVMQLNWVFDEFFVSPDAYDRVFQPLGIKRMKVLDKSGRDLPSVFQLVISEEIDVVPETECSICDLCARKKYEPHMRGPFPRFLREPNAPLARTRQRFGSGGSSYRQTVVSQALREALVGSRTRDVMFAPLRGPVERQPR
jgi:hypothetical protein